MERVRTRLELWCSTVWNELRTPLTMILNPLDELARDPACSEIRPRLIGIQRNARRLLHLLDSVLLLAKLQDSRGGDRQRVELELRPRLLSILQAYQIIALRQRVHLSAPRIDNAIVSCERDWPEILFANLISNALKFTDAGGTVIITLESEPDRVLFKVADTGVGIAPLDIGHIFEPFYRVPGAGRRNDSIEQSSGLGLTHVREIVEHLRGQIDVESVPSQGTTFTITLPTVHRGLARVSQATSSRAQLSASVSEPVSEPLTFSNTSQAALLIVEDNAEFSEYLRKELWKRFQSEWSAASEEQATPSGSTNEVDSVFLFKLDAVICAELDDPALDIQVLCTRLHMSPKQIQRKVRTLTGLTPMEYLRQRRLRRAEEILLQGKSVSRTAYATGFSSQSYFTTCFKKWAGETPRSWQKRKLTQLAAVQASAGARTGPQAHRVG